MVASITVARAAMTPIWGPTALPFMLYFPGIMLAAWFGRWGPGLLAVGASALAAEFFFVAPVYQVAIHDSMDLTWLAAFVLVGITIVAGFEAMHRANDQAAARAAETQHSERRERMRAAELEAIMEAVPALVWIAHDPECRAISGNPAAHELLRVDAGRNLSLSGPATERPSGFTVWADGRPLAERELPVQRAARGESVRDYEEEVRFADATSRFLLGNAAPLRDDKGRLRGAVAAFVDITERKRAEQALAARARHQETLYRFVDRMHRARALGELCEAALDAIVGALGCKRASILLFDDTGVMRFVGWRELSDDYRRAVDGHSPWAADARDPEPLTIADVERAGLDSALEAVIRREGIRALAFIPLVADGRLIGKFMTYHERPHTWADEELELAIAIGRQLAFGIARLRDEQALKASEQRLEQAMAAGRMGAWEWNLRTGRVIWSPGLERIHGRDPGSFDGTFEDFRRDIHPEDLPQVLATLERALAARSDYHVTYRAVLPDGSVRWLEAFGRMLLGADGEPERLSGVCIDVSVRREAEVEREELLAREHGLRQAAEEASRIKDEFLAMLSHELRNPLNVILGYSEILLRTSEMADPAALRRMGEALKRNALNQSYLIRDLLDLSRLRSGKLTLDRQTVTLLTAVRNACETVRNEAAARRIDIVLAAADEDLVVYGDLVRLEQIAWNLLSNAVKFTPPGGSVAVRLNRDGMDAVLEVADTGQGIMPDFLPHVFEMFRQADPSASRAHSGMGIGLALVRQLVELHYGTVTGHSEGPGCGSTFTVRLPLCAEAATHSSPSLVSPRGALRGLRVLVVDDSEDTIDMLRRLLEVDGASVVTATSGEEGLARATEAHLDVVLSDISMPGMDGFEFLRRLRGLPGGREVPVMALTGFGQAEDVVRAKREGFQAHMTKPLDPFALTEHLLALRRSRETAGNGSRAVAG